MSFFSPFRPTLGEKKKRGKQPDRRPLCYPLTICWLPAKNLHHSTRNRPWKRELLCCRYFSKHFLSSLDCCCVSVYIFKFFSILSEWQQRAPQRRLFVCVNREAHKRPSATSWADVAQHYLFIFSLDYYRFSFIFIMAIPHRLIGQSFYRHQETRLLLLLLYAELRFLSNVFRFYLFFKYSSFLFWGKNCVNWRRFIVVGLAI